MNFRFSRSQNQNIFTLNLWINNRWENQTDSFREITANETKVGKSFGNRIQSAACYGCLRIVSWSWILCAAILKHDFEVDSAELFVDVCTVTYFVSRWAIWVFSLWKQDPFFQSRLSVVLSFDAKDDCTAVQGVSHSIALCTPYFYFPLVAIFNQCNIPPRINLGSKLIISKISTNCLIILTNSILSHVFLLQIECRPESDARVFFTWKLLLVFPWERVINVKSYSVLVQCVFHYLSFHYL